MVRGQGQSQSPITPPRPKPQEKKAVIYFAVTRTEGDHVAHSGETLIMLSEEEASTADLGVRAESAKKGLCR